MSATRRKLPCGGGSVANAMPASLSIEENIRDPDVLKAANSLVSSDISSDAKATAYELLSNVHDACEQDMQTTCALSSPNAQMSRIMDGMLFQLLSGRSSSFYSSGPIIQLGSTGGPDSGFMGYSDDDDNEEEDGYEEEMDSRPMFGGDADGLTEENANTIVFEFGRRLTSASASASASSSAVRKPVADGLRLLKSLKRTYVSPVLRKIGVSDIVEGRGRGRRLQQGPPPPPHSPPHGPPHGSPHGPPDGPPHGPPPPHGRGRSPPSSRKQDNLYTGSLGLGSSQDACVYRNFQDLQPACKAAIADVYSFRQDYYSQSVDAAASSSSHHAHGHWFLLFLIPLVIVLAIKRRMRRLRVNKTLNAIHANPHLREQLEAILGEKVPEAFVPCKRACRGGVRGCLITLFRLVLIVLASFFIAASSLVISVNIVASMSHTDANGNVSHPSQPAAVAVLMLVTSMEVLLLVAMMKGCKLMFLPSPFAEAEVSSSATGPSGPSAPAFSFPGSGGSSSPRSGLSEPLVSHTDNTLSTDNAAFTPRYRSFFTRLARGLHSFQIPSSSLAGYSQVRQQDEAEYVEMPSYYPGQTPLSGVAQPGSVVTQSVPLPIQSHVQYVPVAYSAQPVTHVSML